VTVYFPLSCCEKGSKGKHLTFSGGRDEEPIMGLQNVQKFALKNLKGNCWLRGEKGSESSLGNGPGPG